MFILNTHLDGTILLNEHRYRWSKFLEVEVVDVSGITLLLRKRKISSRCLFYSFGVFKTDTIEATLKKKVQLQLTALGDDFDAPVSNKTMLGLLLAALQSMKQNTNIAVNRSFEIRKPLTGISLAGAIGMGEKIEQLRWPVTMAVLSALLVLCVVLVVGVARHSRCVLITYVFSFLSFPLLFLSSLAKTGLLPIRLDSTLWNSCVFASEVTEEMSMCQS